MGYYDNPQTTFDNEDASLTLSAFVFHVIAKHDVSMLDNNIQTRSIEANGRSDAMKMCQNMRVIMEQVLMIDSGVANVKSLLSKNSRSNHKTSKRKCICYDDECYSA